MANPSSPPPKTSPAQASLVKTSPSKTSPIQASPAQALPTARRRILVVEDNALANRALCVLLQHYDYEALTATTVAQALVLLRTNPDEVLLDLGLPDGPGESILSQIRRTGQRCRVRVITGNNDPARLAKLKHLHPDSLYPKPVNFLELLQDISAPAA